MTPCAAARAAKLQTSSRYCRSRSGVPSFPSKLWSDTLTLWSVRAASSVSVCRARSVPFVVMQTFLSRAAARASSSASCGWLSGSPITCRYTYSTCPVRRSSTRLNSAGVIVRGARFVPGQNEQRRLQRFVISMYAFFSIRARPPFIFLSIAQRRALANTVFFCYNGGTRAKESFP